MAIGNGFNHFISWKAQTAHGTKASGLSKTLVPIRSGQIFDPQSFRKPRGTVVAAVPTVANLLTVAKVVPWTATIELVNPTSTNDSIRDWLTTALGLCTTAVGPPITNTFTISDPLIDGGVDTGTQFFGRGLTLHEQADKTDGTAIFAHEVQDAVIDQMQVIFEPDAVTLMNLSGMASDLQDDQTDITPSNPTGNIHEWSKVRNTANSGLRIGTTNPPTVTDNVVYSKATFTTKNNIRYEPWCGEAATQQVRIPVRGDVCDLDLELVLDVEDNVASQYDAKNMVDDWVAASAVNLDFLSFISSNEIFEIKASAATNRSAIVDRFDFSTPSAGPMQAVVGVKLYPDVLGTDFIIKVTRAS